MSLRGKLDALTADFKAGRPPYNAPPEVHQIMERATAELIASGLASRTTKAGDRAPQFLLKDQDGNDVSSDEMLSKGPLIVLFQRGTWCPYSNLELQAINEVLPQIQSEGANVVAISPQTANSRAKSVHARDLRFRVLSDLRNEAAAAFGLRYHLPDYLIDVYKKLKNDLPAFNGDPSWTLPLPARYVIGQDGFVRYSEVDPDHTRRREPSELLPVLEQTVDV